MKELYDIIEFITKSSLTFVLLITFGVLGFLSSRLFKISDTSTVIVTISSSILVTLYFLWWIKNFWDFIYHILKQYIPKKKRRIREQS